MTGKPEHWERAQKNERKHWDGMIAGLMEGPPDYGGEKFWLDLWRNQARFLLGLIGPDMSKHTRTLEIGGGVIGVIRWLKGVKVTVDPLEDLFSEAFPKLRLAKYGLMPRDLILHVVGAAEDIAWANMRPFDFVLMLNTLDHCRDPKTVLEAVHGVLKLDGWLLEATTAAHVKFERSEEYKRFHPWAWTKEELIMIIDDAGFDLIAEYDDFPVHPGYKTKGASSDQVLHVWRKK